MQKNIRKNIRKNIDANMLTTVKRNIIKENRLSDAEHAELKENVISEMNNELELAHIRIENA